MTLPLRLRIPYAVSAFASRETAAPDPRAANANRGVWRFLLLLAQLGLLALLFRVFVLEEPTFALLTRLAFGGFAVHYWLPFRYKEPFWIGLSMAGSFVLLDPVVAALLVGSGLVFFAVLRSGLSYRVRVSIVVAAFAAIMASYGSGGLHLPSGFRVMFGSLFMFRMMIYLYDLRHNAGPPNLSGYLSYFFPLPNFYFILFPVIDYQTMRRSYFQRDIHEVAQQGIRWIARGAVHLILYRLVYHYKDSRIPDNVTSFESLIGYMVLTYLLYLRVSGHFHIIIGMMHLFGYQLPETHRGYLLASSLTDFWRRINIYWKDFMVKLVYFPVYFKLRRSGDVRAQVVATSAVFLATWALHSYQYFWLKGEFLFTWPDSLFWGILGLLVIINLLYETKKKRRKPGLSSWGGKVRHAFSVMGTFALIVTLWSLWQSPSVDAWIDLLTWWAPKPSNI